MAITAEQLQRLHIGAAWLEGLNETFERFDLSTPLRQAAFIGQCGHECAHFKVLEENLNYRAEALMKLWPKRFPTLEIANQYARQPTKIANKVYASRMGNRDEASGDGARFKGRGAIQLTGHANYFHAGKALGVDFIKEPSLVATPRYAALTAGWFWSTHGCNLLSDKRDWVGLTKRINGGTIGLDDRIKHINEALVILV